MFKNYPGVLENYRGTYLSKSEKSVPEHPSNLAGRPFDDVQTSWEHSWSNPEKVRTKSKNVREVTPTDPKVRHCQL